MTALHILALCAAVVLGLMLVYPFAKEE